MILMVRRMRYCDRCKGKLHHTIPLNQRFCKHCQQARSVGQFPSTICAQEMANGSRSING